MDPTERNVLDILNKVKAVAKQSSPLASTRMIAEMSAPYCAFTLDSGYFFGKSEASKCCCFVI